MLQSPPGNVKKGLVQLFRAARYKFSDLESHWYHCALLCDTNKCPNDQVVVVAWQAEL